MEADAKRLKDAIELALPYFGSGPTSSAYGQVVEDCALAHIDYFGGVSEAASHLIGALSEITGEEPAAIHKRLMRADDLCDCGACAGDDASIAKRQEVQARILDNLTPEFRTAIRGRLLSDETVRDVYAGGPYGKLLDLIEGSIPATAELSEDVYRRIIQAALHSAGFGEEVQHGN